MVATSDPVVPMDIEGSRAYLDDLFCNDQARCLRALRQLKNTVIGSNREKRAVIQQGVLARLLKILSDLSQVADIQTETIVVLTSLAKGTPENASALVREGTVPILLEKTKNLLIEVAEASLKCIRTISASEPHALGIIFNEPGFVDHLITLIPRSRVTQETAPSVLAAACHKSEYQSSLLKRGLIEKLCPLLNPASPAAVHLAALECIYKVCEDHYDASTQAIGTTGLKPSLVALLSRMNPPTTQLAAAKCVSAWHNVGAVNDAALVRKAVALLIHLCKDARVNEVRVGAARALSHLIENDPDLQYMAAISERLIQELASYLTTSDEAMQESALYLYAALGASNEDVRKRIIEANVVTHILHFLQTNSTTAETAFTSKLDVKVAALTCLLSLSRSVHQLRTLFQDISFWRILRWFSPSAPTPPRNLFAATTALLCNMLLQFSPCKEAMLEEGAIEILCAATKNKDDPSLRLNGIWALMNVAFQADQGTKGQILSSLGTDQIFTLLSDSDERILIKTLGLLRNVLAGRPHIDFFMGLYGRQIVQAVVLVSESDRSAAVKEQALCILANIADGDVAKDYIMLNEDVLKKLMAYLRHSDADLVKAAVGCVFNLVYTACPVVDSGAGDDAEMRDSTADRHKRLREIGVFSILQQLGNSTADPSLLDKVRETLQYFTAE